MPSLGLHKTQHEYMERIDWLKTRHRQLGSVRRISNTPDSPSFPGNDSIDVAMPKIAVLRLQLAIQSL